jgi:hypothetical protein
MRKFVSFGAILVLTGMLTGAVFGQSTTATISGTVTDERQGVMPGATVTLRNVGTNTTRSALTDSDGRYRIVNLEIGQYELTVDAKGFSRHVRTGIELILNQAAVADITMRPSTVEDVVTVTENVSLLNTSNAEVGVRFDSKRISELPVATNRNVFNIALSAPGVSELGSGQTGFANGVSFSSNGMRLRSNNFMIDGQDSNDPSVSGAQQPVNNPDIVQEIQLVTNQFTAEYGRNSGSVMNIVTKSGNNSFHGSAFWFHNGNKLNALSNLDKRAGRTKAPFRIENQIGGTIGGPVIKNKTFFFGSYQRWTDRQLGSGFTLNGAPTEAGRQILQQAAGSRPQVAALLKFLPAAQSPIGANATFTLNGQTFTVPLGSLTGSSNITLNNDQWLTRIDHNFNENHKLNGRYMFSGGDTSGSGQVTPAGLTTVNPSRTQGINIAFTSVLTSRLVNELRTSWQRLGTETTAFDSSSEAIPSIEISELGLTGFNAAANRTAIGLAVNLPQFRFNNTYQIQDNLSYNRGSHSLKFGFDVRRIEVKSFFFPTIRGLLRYPTLQSYVNDLAEAANINKPLPGGEELQYYQWHDVFFYAQDEWKVRPNFTLTYGLRYETPGNSIASLVPLSERIVAAAKGDQRFALSPVPKRDTNNFQPRFGFNWNPRTSSDGILGMLTGGDKLVVRGGYARTNDYAFININLNIASAFPFVAAISLPATTQPNGTVAIPNAFTALPAAQPAGLDANQLTRTIVGEDFRSPYADQFSFEMSREMSRDVVARIAYVATKGGALFQTIDGNPRLPNSTTRLDPTRGVIRLRANAAASIYHSMQVSVDKRLSRNFSAGVHYTWSAFIDDASEIFNPSSGEVAVSQDSFNRRADRARSSYDRPHRFTGNFVYELPFYREQAGAIGRLLGGWQVNSNFTFQSGAPFTVLNGSDPTGALSGINSLVGDAIRPNLNTNLDVSSMNIIELLRAGGASLFSRLSGTQRVGNAGRNILRADGINRVDFGILKNIKIFENHSMQFRGDFFNATNTRDFGIPEGRVNSSAFLNQWGTNGGSRRIILGLRYIF